MFSSAVRYYYQFSGRRHVLYIMERMGQNQIRYIDLARWHYRGEVGVYGCRLVENML